MRHDITYVGLDAHKNSIVAYALPPGDQPPRRWELVNRNRTVQQMTRKLMDEHSGRVMFCYEAGPCGYALQRQIEKEGAVCDIIAPSLIPRKPGERIKTDRRDAKKLAEYFKAGSLTRVHPPDEDQEAVRDLCRCREAALGTLGRHRHQLGKLLLRRDIRFEGGKRSWTHKHRQWLHGLHFDNPIDQIMFDDYLLAIEQAEERLWGLEQHLMEIASREPFAEPIGWLCCFRGISTLTAFTIVVELHDFWRFPSPERLMAFVGLVPSEHSSGDNRRQGSITKTGNSHVRRVVVEAAHHYRHKPGVNKHLRERRQGQPPWVVALADQAQRRLHRRYCRLLARGKPHNVATVAVARELIGFIWEVLYTHAIRSLEAAN